MTISISLTHTHTHLRRGETDKTTAEMKTHVVTVGGWKPSDRVRARGADIFLYPSLM